MGSLRKIRKELLAAYDITPSQATKVYQVEPGELIDKINEPNSPLAVANMFETNRQTGKKIPYYLLRTKDLDKLYSLRVNPVESKAVKELIGDSDNTEQESESINE